MIIIILIYTNRYVKPIYNFIDSLKIKFDRKQGIDFKCNKNYQLLLHLTVFESQFRELPRGMNTFI